MSHLTKFEVMDCHCDMAFGVNHAVYCNYLEHARHKFLKSIGVDFAEYAKRRIGFVIMSLELSFKHSLISGDEFVVETSAKRFSKFRFQFDQQIRRADEKIILNSKLIGLAVDEKNGIILPPELEQIALDFSKKVE